MRELAPHESSGEVAVCLHAVVDAVRHSLQRTREAAVYTIATPYAVSASAVRTSGRSPTMRRSTDGYSRLSVTGMGAVGARK